MLFCEKWPPTRKRLCLILSNFLPQFLFTIYLENYREIKLKVFLLFGTFFEAFLR